MPEHLYAIVLAAGDGTRVRGLTKNAHGLPAPKQFSVVAGNRTLLGATVDRASRLVSEEHIVVVVAEEHRCFWSRDLASHSPENVVVQPSNRGTAAGLLLPFLEVLQRDPQAQILVLPSDHHVENEEPLARAMVEAVEVARRDRRVVLLGAFPEEPDTEYGWIVPDGTLDGCRGVSHFIEKPDGRTARDLMARGGLLNTLILAADARTLLHLYARHLPELLGELLERRGDLADIYRRLPLRDLSRHLLAPSCDALAVVPVADCGWSDVGTPERLEPLLACAQS
ncbi:MAG TPA: sugar phosphate nucleotidyltransferase [Candidatus Polarisedimenticolia bacterium]|nr:sugar phosphate nucleotidyltransferase [Candidatus Polarisedimenticolia bacterium]